MIINRMVSFKVTTEVDEPNEVLKIRAAESAVEGVIDQGYVRLDSLEPDGSYTVFVDGFGKMKVGVQHDE